MPGIDYTERIPNNVNLAENRRLQRALEEWQPKFLEWWTEMGPWDLGGWFLPLSGVGVAYCAALIVIGMQPPNERAAWVVGAFLAALGVIWFGWARRHFPGPVVLQARSGRASEEA